MGTLFNSQHSRRVSNNDIDIRDIKEMVKKLNLPVYGARTELVSLLNRAQDGGITREEVTKALQKMILDGKVSENKAEEVARTFGLPGFMVKKLKDISESRESRAFHSQSSSSGNQSHEPEEKGHSAEHAGSSFNSSKTSSAGSMASKKDFGANLNSSSSKPPSKIWSALRKINN